MHRRSVKQKLTRRPVSWHGYFPALGNIDDLANSTHTDSEAAAFGECHIARNELVVVTSLS